MNYRKLKLKQQNECDMFPWKFACNEKQFEKIMTEWGFQVADTDKICYLGSACFIRKSDEEAYYQMKNRHKEEYLQAIQNDKTGNNYIYQMFKYELKTHNFEFLHNLEIVLDTLNLTIEQINASPKLKHGFQKALKDYTKDNMEEKL